MNEIAPGATIGILGGGQLGRMLAIAAARLGYRTHVFCPEDRPPASHVASIFTCARYDDQAALERFAASVAFATYEFENMPDWTVRFLAGRIPVRPDTTSLATTQDRLVEKKFARSVGAETVAFAPIDASSDHAVAPTITGMPAILKTVRFGYDGKGQRRIESATELAAAWREMGAAPSILEAIAPFEREISVVAARGIDGTFVAFDIPENVHANGILRSSSVPARIDGRTRDTAISIARAIADGLGHVGVLAVEFFVLAGGRLLVNEIAPRVHNSGHWTIDACATDQFEQHVRAICGLPLGSPARHSDVVMNNLLGDEWLRWPELLRDPAIKLHLYGKDESRPGRKMGHYTTLSVRRPGA
ncbi:MAG: 5-(carboxyamino)imidazole ribonucleotide synthase [Alphaproteobacteria bacterium]|nr:5-(carboxyamino)imidazole ribonucleotide synthase [Alphaproteobacteria bacterium]